VQGRKGEGNERTIHEKREGGALIPSVSYSGSGREKKGGWYGDLVEKGSIGLWRFTKGKEKGGESRSRHANNERGTSLSRGEKKEEESWLVFEKRKGRKTNGREKKKRKKKVGDAMILSGVGEGKKRSAAQARALASGMSRKSEGGSSMRSRKKEEKEKGRDI